MEYCGGWCAVSPYNRNHLMRTSIKLAFAGACVTASFLACRHQPAIGISLARGKATIDVQTLGEYPTTILRAVLSEESTGRTVWEIRASAGTPQIHKLVFVVGLNNVQLAQPESGAYEVLIPLGETQFRVEPDTEYQIAIWRDGESRPSRSTFRIPR